MKSEATDNPEGLKFPCLMKDTATGSIFLMISEHTLHLAGVCVHAEGDNYHQFFDICRAPVDKGAFIPYTGKVILQND